MPKDPTTKEGTVEVPGLGSLIEKSVDDRHQSNHFGEPPLKEHHELPSEEDQNKSIGSSSTQTGTKSLDSIDKSIESSSTQTGAKGLDAIDQSIGSSSSQEGNRSANDKESESWLSNKKALFDESRNELKKWGDLSDEEDNDKSVKDSNVTDNNKDGSTTMEKEDNFDPNDPNLYNLVPMKSSMFDPTHVAKVTNPMSDANDNPGSVPLPTNPFADGREWSFISEKEGLKGSDKTQVQESSSVEKPLVVKVLKQINKTGLVS